jgi:rhamnosyltransferase
MKILGVITSFYPNIDELEKNINSFLEGIEHLIIWENTPKEKSNIDELIEKLNSTKIEVRTTGHNEYLAVPFNLCAKFAVDNGFTHILTMDQDSCFSNNDFNIYRSEIEKYTLHKVAAFGPNSTSREQPNTKNGEVDHIFISGAIYPLNVFFELDGFNEELVIDAIDTDYCFRARNNNYKIIVFPNVNLEHNLGYRYKHWSGLVIVPYSAQRTYYYLRNTFWLWKNYPEYYKKTYKKHFIKYRVVYRLLKLMLEKNSFMKYISITFAILHFRMGKLGRFDKF